MARFGRGGFAAVLHTRQLVLRTPGNCALPLQPLLRIPGRANRIPGLASARPPYTAHRPDERHPKKFSQVSETLLRLQQVTKTGERHGGLWLCKG